MRQTMLNDALHCLNHKQMDHGNNNRMCADSERTAMNHSVIGPTFIPYSPVIDWLGNDTGVVLNVRPDEQGRVCVDRALLGDGVLLQVVVVDHSVDTLISHWIDVVQLNCFLLYFIIFFKKNLKFKKISLIMIN